MFESLESRQLMSATLTTASPVRTAEISDGTSNTIMVAEVYAKPGKPAGQETYMKYEMENVMITSYS